MADNSSIPVAVGNETFANKDIAGVKYPKHILHDSSGAEIIGTKADAKSTATDTTAVTAMSVWKQISASVQAAASALAGTLTVATHAVTQSGSWVLSAGSALIGKVGIDQTTDGTTNKVAADLRLAGTAADKGAGTGGSATQRVIVDSSQFSPLGQTTKSASAPVVLASDSDALPTIAKPTATANGQTSSRVNSAGSTNATSLKASAGQVGEVDVFNNAAYAVFLKFYNKASSPTVGTDTPVWTIPVPAGGGFSKSFPRGKSFATGIAYAITKLQADSDTTAVVAGDLTGSIDWI